MVKYLLFYNIIFIHKITMEEIIMKDRYVTPSQTQIL